MCFHTGRDFVKKSARLIAPGRKETLNWWRRTRSRIQSNLMSIAFDFLALIGKPGGGPTQHRGDRRDGGGTVEKAALGMRRGMGVLYSTVAA